MAMHTIKQKKFVLGLINKRLNYLETLERIMFKLDHADTEADVIFNQIKIILGFDCI